MTKVALITGSGRGIGAATAKLAARRGYVVCVNYLRRPDSAEQVVAEIHDAGGRAIAVEADVGDPGQVKELFARIDRDLGPITALVNNAGIVGRFGRLEDDEPASLRRVMDVNVVAAMACAREAVKRMSIRHGGAGGGIVNVSSIASVHGAPNQMLAYATSKGAIDTFTVGLAKELGPDGIRVNAISPGLIDTEIRRDAGADPDMDRAIIAQVPLGRIGRADECAEAICWLLSDAASYVSGAILPVTGGR